MISRLVGKSDKHVSRDKILFYNRLLYQVKMGYVDMEYQSAHQSILYRPEEHTYEHDLSLQSIGRRFSSGKIGEYISLDFYMNSLPEISDEILKGIMIGLNDRERLEKEALEAEERRKALEREQAAQNINQLHDGQ